MKYLKKIFVKIDRIKDELYDISCKLEEAGNIMKAKSLRTIIGMLEDWEHRTGRR